MAWDIQTFWFFMLGVLLAGYAVLDGFDLGVGTLHLFVGKTDEERRVVMNSIGPLWDGNEVWLVTFGGALFAAFPVAYASALSGLYLGVMLLLVTLVGRAVAIEFRSKRKERWWRAYWDFSFSAASTLVTFVGGVAVGNAMQGLPIGPDQEIRGHGLLDLLSPYPILVGVLAVSASAMHGAIYLYLKTEGALQGRLEPLMWRTFGLFLVLYVLTTIVTLVTIPHATHSFRQMPIAWVVVGLAILAVANVPRAIHQRRAGYAFVSSSATIAALVFLFGMALYPNLLVSSLDPSYSITLYSAASSEKTLHIMQLVAFIGLPLIASYTAVVYWVFRGKTRLDSSSY